MHILVLLLMYVIGFVDHALSMNAKPPSVISFTDYQKYCNLSISEHFLEMPESQSVCV